MTQEPLSNIDPSQNWKSTIVAGNRLWAVLRGQACVVDIVRVNADHSLTIVEAYSDTDQPHVVQRSQIFITQRDARDAARRS